MGADRHVEAAQSSLSTTTPPPRDEEEKILRIVADLACILKVDPKHQRAVQPAVDLIKRQVMEIGRLREALLQVRTELRGIVGELKGEELKVIVALQGMIFDLLDIADDEAESRSDSLSSSSLSLSTTSPSFFLSSSSSPSSLSMSPSAASSSITAPRQSKREHEGVEALAGVMEVFGLENQGKSVAAAEKLASLPQGTHVGAETIGNASHALGQLLYRLGGLNTVGRVLDSFFARPAVRTA